jgi:hypothetical protein
MVVLLAIGIIFIGVRFLAAPRTAAAAFGVPAGATPQMAYLWAKGTRDIVSGLLLLGLLGMRVRVSALAIHAGTAAFMLILAALLWRTSAS